MSRVATADRDYFMVSERLGFGIWGVGDDDLAAMIWGDPEVTRLTGGPFTVAQVRARLDAEIANLSEHGFQYWPIFRRDTGTLIGCCGLRPREEDSGTAELGFQLCRDAWGQGYAGEAAGAVIAWASADRLAALIAGHHPENHASRHTLRRLGFRYTHDELYPPTGQMEPCYGLDLAGRDAQSELDRETLVALIDRTLRAEAQADAPPEAERGDWFYGSPEPLAFTEPDQHGWMAIEPATESKVWMPRALVFWRMAVTVGPPVIPRLAAHPSHSLARWPAIESAVRDHVT